MQCVACRAVNPTASRFCNQCGESLPLICRTCKSANPIDAEACVTCSAVLSADSRRSGSHEPAEVRQITVMFIDLVGSTALSRSLEVEDFRDFINEYHAACREVVTGLGGHISQYLGDGVLVYFGYPEANDDDARRAAHAALALVERVKSLSQRIQLILSQPSLVRIGIHTGIVVIGQVGEERQHIALGEVPNLAARLQQLAEPDSVFLSEATRRLIDAFFVLEFVGEEKVRGFDQPVAVHRLIEATGVQSRVAAAGPKLGPLVGRKEETAELERQWRVACVQNSLRIALLTGEAGIGKSRQVEALKHDLHGSCQLLEAYCSPIHQQSALRPIAQVLETTVGLSLASDPVERFQKLARYLNELGLPADFLPDIAGVLSLPVPAELVPAALAPQVKRRRTMLALLGWVRALARRAPLLFVMEDLHWADPSTSELLSSLADSSDTEPVPILLVATARPEFARPWLDEFGPTISLQRLAPEVAELVIHRVAGGRSIPPDVVARVIDLTDGVPLYLEEVTKAILEPGELRLVGAPDRAAGSVPEIVVPPTVQDSLMARLDRLGESKAVAQLAAVLGREFSHEVLLTVALADEAFLNVALKRLTDSGLIVKDQKLGNYRFKHALIQETAYQSLLKSRRQQYHHRIATVLSDQFPEIAERTPGLVAQHYGRANLPDLAATYFERAGDQGFAAQAYAEAISNYQSALDEFSRIPQGRRLNSRELKLLTSLGLPLLMTKGYASPEVDSTYERALELCAEVVPPIRVLYGLWVVESVRGNRDSTQRMATQFAHIAESSHNSAERLIAGVAVGVRYFWVGQSEAAIRALTEAVNHFEIGMLATLPRDYGYDNALFGHLMLLHASYLAGRVGEAERLWQAVQAITEPMKSPYLTVMVLVYGAVMALDLHDAAQALELSERCNRLAQEHQLLFWLALSRTIHGSGLCQVGRAEEGKAEIEQGLALLRATGASVPLPYYLCYLADACLSTGATAEGFAVVDEALGMTAKNYDRNCESELLRLKAELLWKTGDETAAAQQFAEAIAVARTDGLGLFELLAATSYAKFLHSSGRSDLARRALAEATERILGGEPPVLLEARALLHEISLGRSPRAGLHETHA